MTEQQARELAVAAIEVVTVGEPESVADTTVLFKNADGTFSVCDNGEEAIAATPEQAIQFIVENLTA